MSRFVSDAWEDEGFGRENDRRGESVESDLEEGPFELSELDDDELVDEDEDEE